MKPYKEHKTFKKIVKFSEKNRGAYALVCLLVLLAIIIYRVVDGIQSEGGFDFKTFILSLIDLKVFVAVILAFVLTGVANLLGGLFSPKVEDMMKLTTNYDSLVKKYGHFSKLVKYTNSSESDYLTGRKHTTSQATNFKNDKYDGVEDTYVFPTEIRASLKNKTTNIVFDDKEENAYKQPDWIKEHSDELFAAHSHSEKYNSQMLRVNDFKHDEKTATIYLSKTTYLDSLIANRACDYEINGVSVREVYEPGPVLHSLKDSQLSNHLGFNGMVETNDHKFIFIKRHNKVSIAKNTWQTSIGASLKTIYALNENKTVDTSSIKNAMIEEMIHEFNLKNLKNLKEKEAEMREKFSFEENVLYFYRDLLECGKPQLMFHYELPLSSSELVEAFTNGLKAAKKNKDTFNLYCDIDGHNLLLIDREDMKKLYLTPDGFAYKKKFYKSVPSAVATIRMLIANLNGETL